jgi:hypothetical protein
MQEWPLIGPHKRRSVYRALMRALVVPRRFLRTAGGLVVGRRRRRGHEMVRGPEVSGGTQQHTHSGMAAGLVIVGDCASNPPGSPGQPDRSITLASPKSSAVTVGEVVQLWTAIRERLRCSTELIHL